MSARDGLLRHLTGQSLCPPPRPVEEATGLLDAYRAEVLAEAKIETVAWLVKKAAEQETWDAAVLASKIDRGAVRAFLGTGHYRDALDEYRAKVRREVLTEAAGFIDSSGTRFPVAVRNGVGWAVRTLRRLADDTPTTEPAEPAPDFFQPGHGYTHRDGTDFLCIAVTTHPNTGEPRALGWIVRNGWHEPGACDPDDWTRNYDGVEPPADEDEWVRCSHLHCPNSERYAKATERGWTHHHMDTWRCPQHPLTKAGESRG